MSEEGKALPSYGRFAWMLFMQPVSLGRILLAVGVGNPNESLWTIWREKRCAERVYLQFLLRMAFMLLILMPCVIYVSAWLLGCAGFPADWQKVAFGVTFCVAGGVVGGAVGGVAFGVATGLAGGVAFFVFEGLTALGVVRGVAFGVSAGVSAGMASCLIECVVRSVARSMTFDVACGVILGVFFGFFEDVALSVALTISYILISLRTPIYIIEYVIFWCSGKSLRAAPPLYHEMSYFPIMGLRQCLLSHADAQQQKVKTIIEKCLCSLGQRNIAYEALCQLSYREFGELAETGDWEKAASLGLHWLPEVTDTSPIIHHFKSVAKNVLAATQEDVSAKRAVGLFDDALLLLDITKLPSPRAKNPYDPYFLRHAPELIEKWRGLIQPLRKKASIKAEDELPNPFISNAAGIDTKHNREVFRGREEVLRRTQKIIMEHRSAIALIGPRRSGKTSLLQMLSVFLPEQVVVVMDLMSGAGASTAAFFRSMDETLAEAMRDHRNYAALPRLKQNAGMEDYKEWLDSLEKNITNYRVMFCLDEYERLAELYTGNKQELQQLLGLIRYSIQHRNKVRFLLAGATPLQDMDTEWVDNAISFQNIQLDFLTRDDTVKLLHQPTATFPPDVIPLPLAEKIYELTAGQPSLVQRFGNFLVDHLNDTKRKQATWDDVEEVKEEMLDRVVGNELADYKKAPYGGGNAFEQLAIGKIPDWQPGARHWLQVRGYITAEDKIRIPLFGEWLRRELEKRR